MAADTRDDHREINRRLMQVIQHAIQQKGMTRREIEHLAQASSPTVSDWFNKGAVPDAVTIARLCRGLRVNAHWVLTGIGPQALPGEGRSDADQAFALGASAVVSDLRDSVSVIEARWGGQSSTRSVAEVLRRLVEQEDRRTAATPGRRTRARKTQ